MGPGPALFSELHIKFTRPVRNSGPSTRTRTSKAFPLASQDDFNAVEHGITITVIRHKFGAVLQAAIIRLLLQRGAKPTDKDGRGKSVRQAARSAWVRALLVAAPEKDS